MLVLAQVGQLVVGGQPLLARPGPAPAGRPGRPAPGPAGPEPAVRRASSRRRSTRSASSSSSRAPARSPSAARRPGHADPPPVRVLRQPGLLPELVGAAQVLARGREVVRARGRPGSGRPACRRCRAAAGPARARRARGRARRCARASPSRPWVISMSAERDRAAEDVGDVPGRLEAVPGAAGVARRGRRRGRRWSRTRGRRAPRRPPRIRWSSSAARVEGPLGAGDGAGRVAGE